MGERQWKLNEGNSRDFLSVISQWTKRMSVIWRAQSASEIPITQSGTLSLVVGWLISSSGRKGMRETEETKQSAIRDE